MSADVKTLGTIKAAPYISYVETRLGTTYHWRGMSIQLIRTNGRVEYRNPLGLPDITSCGCTPQLWADLGAISKHFTKQVSSNGRRIR